jgi:hypothetical protein
MQINAKHFAVGSLVALACVGLYSLFPVPGSLAQGLGGPGSVVVLCSSCSFSGMQQEGDVVLMDSRSGEIWAYSDSAMVGTGKPVYVGTLAAVGQPVSKKR